MIEEIFTRSADPIKIKLIKGQRNNYGWEISVQGSDPDRILVEVRKIDASLKGDFRGEEVK